MTKLYAYLLFRYLYIAFAFIGCSTPQTSAAAVAIDDTHSYAHRTLAFDAYDSLVNDNIEAISSSTSFDKVVSSYGADRQNPFPVITFRFQLKMNSVAVTLPRDLSYCLLEFFTLSELQILSSFDFKNEHFTQSVKSFLNSKNPFPYINIERMDTLQLDNLLIAGKLIKKVYPALHLKGIESYVEIGAILQLTYLMFHIEHVPKIADDMLEQFIVLYVYSFRKFSFPRAEEILRIKTLILSKEYNTSFDISIQLGFITVVDVNSKVFFTELSQSPSFYIVHKMLKLLLDMDEITDSDKKIHDLTIDAIVSDNVNFFKAFLGLCDLTETFLQEMISVLAVGSRLHKITLELFSNSLALSFFENNPQLILLPERYFETYSNTSGLFIAYISSHLISQRHDHIEFILRASLSKHSESIFVALLNNEHYPILPDYLSKIIDNLSSIEADFIFESISSFWNSNRIYKVFSQLSLTVRRVIFDRILQEKRFYHIFALAECRFAYFDEFLNSPHDLIGLTVEILLGLKGDFSFYEHSISVNQFFLNKLDTFKAFNEPLHHQYHSQFLITAIKYIKYYMFLKKVHSDSISLHFEDFKEIIRALSVRERENDEDRLCPLPYKVVYSYSFWTSSRTVLKIFKEFSEENRIQLIKEIVFTGQYSQLYAILDGCDDEDFYVVSDRFDLVAFCFRNNVESFIINEMVKRDYFKIRFPKPIKTSYRIRLALGLF